MRGEEREDTSDERTILVVESRHVGWHYVKEVLGRYPPVQVVGGVTREEAIQVAEQVQPAIIFLAADKQAGGGISLTSELVEHDVATRVVVFSEEIVPEVITELRAGHIAGHMLWDEVDADKLRTGVEAVLAGHPLVSPTLLAAWGGSPTDEPSAQPVAVSQLEELVLMGLLADRTERQIAEELRLSDRTVRLAVSRLKRKFDCHTLAGLSAAARERGYRRRADPRTPD
jgi:two-component system nitrate/nitrite response regulator NarL